MVTKFQQMLRVKGITNQSFYVYMPARFDYCWVQRLVKVLGQLKLLRLNIRQIWCTPLEVATFKKIIIEIGDNKTMKIIVYFCWF